MSFPEQDVAVPVLVHAGLHKTGTTWLQRKVFQPGAGRDFLYVDSRVLLRGILLKPEMDAFDPAAARAAFSGVLEEARARALPVVISDEALAGFPYQHKHQQGIALRRIREVFPEGRLLVTIREQTSVVYSVYGHYIRGGNTSNLDGFLEEPAGDARALWEPILDRSFYDYDRLHRYCTSLFGEERVTMVPMEWMLARPGELIDLLRRRTGFDWTAPEEATAADVVNPAWSDLAYEAARHANRFCRAGPRWHDTWATRLPARLAYWTDRLTPKSLRRSMRERRTETIRRRLGDAYAVSNRIVSERIGIDLAAHGYRVGGPETRGGRS